MEAADMALTDLLGQCLRQWAVGKGLKTRIALAQFACAELATAPISGQAKTKVEKAGALLTYRCSQRDRECTNHGVCERHMC